MVSQLDFAISAGMFVIFLAVLLIYLTGYVKTYTGLAGASELKIKAYDFFSIIFGSRGVPANWSIINQTPFSIGIAGDLYRIPVVVTEDTMTYRGYAVLNASLTFDGQCEGKALNTTVVAVEGGADVQSFLSNQQMCYGSYLKSSDLMINSSFLAGERKVFYVYFSADSSVNAPVRQISAPAAPGFTISVMQQEKMTAISASKAFALRNISYEDAISTLSTEYKVEIEISDG